MTKTKRRLHWGDGRAEKPTAGGEDTETPGVAAAGNPASPELRTEEGVFLGPEYRGYRGEVVRPNRWAQKHERDPKRHPRRMGPGSLLTGGAPGLLKPPGGSGVRPGWRTALYVSEPALPQWRCLSRPQGTWDGVLWTRCGPDPEAEPRTPAGRAATLPCDALGGTSKNWIGFKELCFPGNFLAVAL